MQFITRGLVANPLQQEGQAVGYAGLAVRTTSMEVLVGVCQLIIKITDKAVSLHMTSLLRNVTDSLDHVDESYVV